jgi:uncharacterized protein YwqG
MQKSSIRITCNAIGECPVGSSKVGGKPDLPLDFNWYYFNGKSYDDIVDNRPLSFLAQINCEEACIYDKGRLLPPKGMLYFFYELVTMTWGFDPKDRGSARVYYYPGRVSELHRTDFPMDLFEEYRFPEIQITFSNKNELPAFEEFCEWYEKDYDWDEYDEAKTRMGFDSELNSNEEEPISKLLGYANVIQNGMLLECEQVTNGIYCGEPIEIPEGKLRQLKENSKKWQLLFQIDSIYLEGREIMMWGDMGRLFYYVKIDDLKKMNFDNCWLILQCG